VIRPRRDELWEDGPLERTRTDGRRAAIAAATVRQAELFRLMQVEWWKIEASWRRSLEGRGH
jgi:hypothetical protein